MTPPERSLVTRRPVTRFMSKRRRHPSIRVDRLVVCGRLNHLDAHADEAVEAIALSEIARARVSHLEL